MQMNRLSRKMGKELIHNNKKVEWITVSVEPRNTGNFGGISISSYHWDMPEIEQRCKQIKEQIERHCDNIESVSLIYEYEDYMMNKKTDGRNRY